MRHLSISYFIALATVIFLSVLTTSQAYSQNYWCHANEISWSHGSTDTKQFTIRSQDSLAFIVNASACHHFYVQTDERNYTVTIVPFSINNAQVDIVQNLYVTIDDYGTPVTETVVLRHCAAPASPEPDPNPDPSPDPDPGPDPEPDPWDDVAAGLPDTLSWIQRTTVTAADGSSYIRDVTFYDGLGYPAQEVLVGASPGGLKSIYTPVVYDNMRRADVRTYLPYAAATAAEIHDPLAITRQASFYASFPYQDTRPFAEKAYETSPVGRPLSLQREGQDWNAGGGHRSTFSYRTNLASDAVPRYRILPGTGKARYDGSWPEGTLRCTETQDEEGAVSRTFTDVFGKTVLSEAQTGAHLPDGSLEKARTLYVYDLRDSLCLVVQPEGMKALDLLPSSPASSRDISLTPGSAADNGTLTDRYCFVWNYDGRGNVLSEHTPGGGTVEYAYDARGRLVLKTDSRMRPEGDTGPRRMIFTSYDQYDRIVEERFVSSPRAGFGTLRNIVRDTVSHTMSPAFIESNLPTLQTLRSSQYFPFTHVSADYPSAGDGAFVPESGIVETSDLETARIKGFLRQETLHPAPGVDGTIPAGAPSVTRYYHYDYRGRVIQLNERWSDGRIRRVSTKYSFTGDVLATKETVIIPAEPGGGEERTASMATFYTRDPRGKVLTCSRVLNGTDTLATVHYSYDDLGRLAGKTVGDGGSPLLETDYTYDLHGWTTGIDVAMADGVGNGMSAVFTETLRYADAGKDPLAKRFDGNISETAYTHWVDGVSGSAPYLQTNTWSYAYDGLKRLTDADHYPGAALTPSLTDTERDIAYDRNGNITVLKRYGASGLENDLSFAHTGNRMTALADAQATGSAAGTKTFSYDANGNLTHDGRKDLDLSWNLLNLVSGAVMHGSDNHTDDSSLTYAWLSDGTKVSVTADDGSGDGVQKRYLGSFVYTSSGGLSTEAPLDLESMAWDEGRVFFDIPEAVDTAGIVLDGDASEAIVDTVTAWVADYRDCWFAGDHLGNVRAVFDITPGLDAAQILEQSDYLPFGTKIQNPALVSRMDNRWQYAGKEAQRFGPTGAFSPMLQTSAAAADLGLLDFGARMYDLFTARWTAVDPMARKYGRLSSFIYCGGNPIGIFDDGGLDLVIAGKNNSSVTFKTDLINKEFSVASLGIDWKGNYTLEGDAVLSAGLDLVGIVDPLGVADLANAALQYKNGDYLGAGLSAIGLIPYAGDLAKVGKVGKDVNIISAAVGTLKVGGDVAPISYRAFTRGNFRNNLIRFTGTNPMGKEAHHLLPNKFAELLSNKGINVHDPKYGRWVDHSIHRKTAHEYNRAFESYLIDNPNATEEKLIEFAESLMKEYELY